MLGSPQVRCSSSTATARPVHLSTPADQKLRRTWRCILSQRSSLDADHNHHFQVRQLVCAHKKGLRPAGELCSPTSHLLLTTHVSGLIPQISLTAERSFRDDVFHHCELLNAGSILASCAEYSEGGNSKVSRQISDQGE
jgi:hypothetical protein